MATITPTLVKKGGGGMDTIYVATWAAMGNADTGTEIQMAQASDRSVQVSGTFGGATVVLQGSNDGTNWVTLTDPQGNAISKTSAAIEQIEEATLSIRPVTSGGTGTSIDVNVLLRGQH